MSSLLGPSRGARMAVSSRFPLTSNIAGADLIVKAPASVRYVGRISSGPQCPKDIGCYEDRAGESRLNLHEDFAAFGKA